MLCSADGKPPVRHLYGKPLFRVIPDDNIARLYVTVRKIGLLRRLKHFTELRRESVSVGFCQPAIVIGE